MELIGCVPTCEWDLMALDMSASVMPSAEEARSDLAGRRAEQQASAYCLLLGPTAQQTTQSVVRPVGWHLAGAEEGPEKTHGRQAAG